MFRESKLAGVEDVRNNLKTKYLYDLSGRTVSITDSPISESGQTVSFTYGVDGLRLSKTITENGTSSTVKYYYNGSSLTDVIYADGNRLHIIYDGSGSPLGFTYKNQTYFYEKNLQGDILGIRNSSGNVTVSYTYDSWGKITSQTNSNLAKINPLRYRGYVYDEETGLYYLQSRYYDSEAGRWISPEPNVYEGGFDNGASLLAHNIYAYCANNPVMLMDQSGESITLACGLVLACAAIIVCFAIVDISNNSNLSKIKSNISKKIITGNGKIDISKFSKKPGSGPPRWIGPLGYELVKDMSEHKGPAYKLFQLGIRIATIALDGTILGK